jgi:hypothetical protein
MVLCSEIPPYCHSSLLSFPRKRESIATVIPAEAGIQKYLDKSLLYFWIPTTPLRGHKLSVKKPGFPPSRE